MNLNILSYKIVYVLFRVLLSREVRAVLAGAERVAALPRPFRRRVLGRVAESRPHGQPAADAPRERRVLFGHALAGAADMAAQAARGAAGHRGAQPQQAARLGPAEVLDVARRATVKVVDHRALACDRTARAPRVGGELAQLLARMLVQVVGERTGEEPHVLYAEHTLLYTAQRAPAVDQEGRYHRHMHRQGAATGP